MPMKIVRMSAITPRFAATLSVAVLTGCAAQSPQSTPGRTAGTLPVAELAARVADNPRDADAHLELARAWDRMARSAPVEAEQYRSLASAGYESALRFAPNDALANLLAGRSEFTAGHFERAQELFASAVLASPDDATALLAFATASYRAGDAPLARLAAERAAQLAPQRTEPLRLATLAAAANGDARGTEQMLQRLAALAGDTEAGAVRTRATALLRTLATDEPMPSGGSASLLPPGSDQVSIDVAIILSQNTRRHRVGFNLLDGLRAQYSYNDQTSESRSSGVGSTQRTITQAISTPALNYNLNIFNNSGQYYQVVARPTLTAYRGEPSEFFIGRTSNIPVSGVNVAQLERVDIGISLKVTPLEINGDRVKVRIETERSFASNEAAGSFAEALTLFRQNVAATAEVGFGETLVLSGLSESVDDSATTKTPGLGDVPVLGIAFNERSRLERRDAALVLLTPSPVTRLPSGPWLRAAAVDKLIRLWSDVVDPASNATDVVARLSRSHLFKRAHSGDAPLLWQDGGGLRSFESLLLSRPF